MDRRNSSLARVAWVPVQSLHRKDMKKIIFQGVNTVTLVNDSLSPEEVAAPGEVVIRNIFSIVSPGTELAVLSGGESWAALPYEPGYGSVGTIADTYDAAAFPIGQLVLTYGRHAAYTPGRTIVLPIPEGLRPEHAVFARMAAVAMTAIRVSDIELGDWVTVLGVGIVGNLAAQLALLSGARVIAVDKNAERLTAASRSGVDAVIRSDGDINAQVAELTGGRMCSTVIDATGVPAAALAASNLVGNHGELILLGTPRGESVQDITPFLRQIHLHPTATTVKGAHEWRYPTASTDNGSKHSIERNIGVIFDLLLRRRLQVDHLISEVAKPERAPEIYESLRSGSGNRIGVLFDWRE